MKKAKILSAFIPLTLSLTSFSAVPMTFSAADTITVTVPVVHEETNEYIDGVSLHLYQYDGIEEVKELCVWNTSDVNPLVLENVEYDDSSVFYVTVDEIPDDYSADRWGMPTAVNTYDIINSDGGTDSDFEVVLFDNPHIEYPVEASLDIMVDAHDSVTGELIPDVGYSIAEYDEKNGKALVPLASGKTKSETEYQLTYLRSLYQPDEHFAVGVFVNSIPDGYVLAAPLYDENSNLIERYILSVSDAYATKELHFSIPLMTEDEAATTITTSAISHSQTSPLVSPVTTTTTTAQKSIYFEYEGRPENKPIELYSTGQGVIELFLRDYRDHLDEKGLIKKDIIKCTVEDDNIAELDEIRYHVNGIYYLIVSGLLDGETKLIAEGPYGDTISIKLTVKSPSNNHTKNVPERDPKYVKTEKTGDEYCKGITWNHYPDGRLVVSGSGAMLFDGDNRWNNDVNGSIEMMTTDTIIIENGITDIDEYAFSYFLWAKSISLPDTLKTIGNNAFAELASLKSVYLPAGLESIGDKAFYDGSLESVTIPGSVTSIGESAFSKCPLESVIISEGVKSIGKYAFSMTDLKSVVLPEGIERIEDGTFTYCQDLEEVIIPESVKYIGKAFQKCSSLKEITIPSGVEKISRDAFYDCTSLETIIFENPDTIICDKDGNEYENFVFPNKSGFSGTFKGYFNSKSEEYAKKSDITFIPMISTKAGDANADGAVSMADAVIIMQSLANPDKYGINGTDEHHITEQGKKNADIAGDNDGVTNADALTIQMKLLGLYKNAPEIVVFEMSPSTTGVKKFLENNPTIKSSYNDDKLYNITPKEITDKYGFKIFKYSNDCETYLEYNGETYQLGTGFGGLGTVSFAVADLNGDGHYELYFSYSCGSGIHSVFIDCFDLTSSFKLEGFDQNWYEDVVFAVENGKLGVFKAKFKSGGFVDIKAEPTEKIGEITFNDETNTIVFVPVDNSDTITDSNKSTDINLNIFN